MREVVVDGSALTVDDVVAAILRGGVIAIPTETVYGLACDPVNAGAVERIYEIKHRPADLELTLLGANWSVNDHHDDWQLHAFASACRVLRVDRDGAGVQKVHPAEHRG